MQFTSMNLQSFLVIVTASICVGKSLFPSPRVNESVFSDNDPYRLLSSVIPVQYTLQLEPDLKNENFKGEVEIEVEVKDSTDTISLHAEGIEFSKISVLPIDTLEEIAYTLSPRDVHEMMDIVLSQDLRTNTNYIIKIEYNGTLRKDMYGFYVSYYYNDEGEKIKLAATHFQPTHARKAFPCFDEPSFKASFQISITTPPGYHCLSNMPREDVTRNDATTIFTFKNSVKMSTYLVAFVISDFQSLSSEGNGIEGEVLFQTWARARALSGAEYSLRISRPMLKVLENYTEILYSDNDFSLNKIDMVALPEFSAGAMENWGLTTFRESALLFNEGSADAQKRVATVIAHELLHMWFGNLITTHWWDTTWLNEGFARYFQYYVTNEVEGDWRMWDQFVVDQLQSVFAADSLSTAHALTHYVSSPSEARSRLSTISYNKGAAVLRMISSSIEPENFQKALQDYLNSKKYDAVVPQDLFDALKQFAGVASLQEEEFQEFLESWTLQPGFPVVNVERNYETNVATISQKRFLFKGESSEQYYVPLTWTLEGNTFEIWRPRVYLRPGSTHEIEEIPSRNWVIFNIQETGYYRVNYDPTNWKLISDNLNSFDKSIDDIHVLNRAQLLDDALNLARANQLSYSVTFDLTDYLTRETDYVPWSAALTGFSHLKNMLVNNVKFPVFQRYVLRLIDKMYEKFNFNVPNSHDEKLLFNKILTWACAFEHKECLDTAADILRLYVEEQVSIPADLRSVVYCYGIYHGNDDHWDYMWAEYIKSQDDVEKGLIASGLSCSSNEERLKELLGYSITEDFIRKQDGPSVFSAVYSNPQGVDVALDFLNTNFNAISDYYGSSGSSLNNIITGIAGRLTTDKQKEKLDDFILRYPTQLAIAGATAQLTVEENLQWLSTHEKEIFADLEDKEEKQHRLPSWFDCTSYTLWLEPDISLGTFNGKVSIIGEALSTSDRIILHSQGLNFNEISVLDITFGARTEVYENHSYDEKLEFLTIYLNTPLTTGYVYQIEISYNGALWNDMYGIYISSYLNEDRVAKKIVATQFQPTYARRSFPCLDEPGFKATFTVTVRTPPYYGTIGNMPALHIRVWDNFTTETVFRPTPQMSTYLLAFVVSDFACLEDTESSVEFRTWARKNALEWGRYSLEISSSLLQSLENYTNIKYPLAKVDQVALPDFSAGAMENWGLITYRETALLYNDGTASAQKSVATIIAHELTHMWFGNLVTTRWWDATWLNEGFAQLFQFFISDVVLPDWRLMDQFLVDYHQASFASDSLVTSAALTAAAYTPSQVSARFGTITYSKGASVLRMVSSILGENNFQQALRQYLSTYRYSSTVPDNLFDYFVEQFRSENLNQEEFRKLLLSWTEQPGFPLITVDRNYGDRTATISQTRFLLKTPESPDMTLYYVPLTWATAEDDFSIRNPGIYLSQEDTSIDVEGMPEDNEWVIFNVQETGYYRVNYDAKNWQLLTEYLLDSKNPLDSIHVLNRAQLLDDAFNLARAGQLSYDVAFDVADYLRRETDFIPFASGLAAFTYLQRMLIHNDRYQLFKKYVIHLIELQYTQFNFQDTDSHIDKLFLNRVSSWACSLNHVPCTDAASGALQKFIDNGESVPADLRSVVYCYGVRHSSDDYWYKLLEEYNNSLDNAERALLMAGLACTHSEDRLRELLEYSIDETIVRKQDASSVFTSVYGNSVGVEVALDFLDKNFNAVLEYYGSMGAINNIVVGIAGRLTTTDQQALLERFVEEHSDNLGASGAAALETVDENLQWLEKHEENIFNFLDRELITFPTTTQGAGMLRVTAKLMPIVILTLWLCFY